MDCAKVVVRDAENGRTLFARPHLNQAEPQDYIGPNETRRYILTEHSIIPLPVRYWGTWENHLDEIQDLPVRWATCGSGGQ